MVRDFKSTDKGKKVVTADGDVVGTVDRVSAGNAHIKPDAGLSRGTRRKLGWKEEGMKTYKLEKAKVNKITNDEIRLK